MPRRIVIAVCPRECGVVSLAVEKGQHAERLDAETIASRLEAIVARRRLEDRVRVQQACAGGCNSPGPNVTVVFYPMPRPGERPDHIASGWKTYVASLETLPCLAAVIDENLGDATPRTRAARSTRR